MASVLERPRSGFAVIIRYIPALIRFVNGICCMYSVRRMVFPLVSSQHSSDSTEHIDTAGVGVRFLHECVCLCSTILGQAVAESDSR
jgi:hypothetical protein